ncbi:hypothetical protein ACIPWF_13615 [Paenarthrobacter sp. NPDC089989]|uniref:hypothetical protein n=1 Tax=unclassified Paenarthrobacter TaxID=2634190 RepID=UPI00381C524D
MSTESWPPLPSEDRERRPWVYLKLIHKALLINVGELKSVIERPSLDKAVRDQVFSPGDAQEEFFGELYTRLHNCAAIVGTLVDVGRPYVRKHRARHPDSTFGPEQERRVTKIGSSVSAQILKGLRNYLLHYNVPHMEITVTQTVSPAQTRSVLNLSSQSLLEWKKGSWESAARSYLGSVAWVDLGQMVDDYLALIEDYYSWLWSEVSSSGAS